MKNKFCYCCAKYVDIDDCKYIGEQIIADLPYSLELYNCKCGTTLTKKVYREVSQVNEMIKTIKEN